ncbi:DUF3570 domain-containing protein [Methylotetracoccus oryzae]|uniref:DUF3570 domain-containing protein n=1 Tax=Methylotetracoccus oryzae TaxID=1919059 RepID=UPI001F2D4CDB|nr:DUF3570 domain-containing protein [Methylotetracoccus oryzae]
MSKRLRAAMRHLRGSVRPSSPSISRAESRTPPCSAPSLQALTAAALALPGLVPSAAQGAEGDEAGFQYGHYQEGGGAGSHFRETGNSIQVDTIQAFAGARLMDRMRVLFNYQEDTWAGATPIAAAPAGSLTRVDNIVGASAFWEVANSLSSFDPDKGVAVFLDPTTGQQFVTPETVQVMAYASPEIRRQGDFNLSYDWDEAAVSGGGGVSIENDFDVWFANLGGRLDFNQKATTLTFGGSYTNSSISAQRFAYGVVGSKAPEQPTIEGTRQDGALGARLVQVLDKSSTLSANVGFTHSTGYLSNPYKQSLFFAPVVARQLNSPDPTTGLLSSVAVAEYDNRPRLRDQVNLSLGYVRYIDWFDASLHADYRFYSDDWGINAHTFEAAWEQPAGRGWMITPRIRYYTQGAAYFYSPYFVLDQTLDYQEFRQIARGDTDMLDFPNNWSSDYRLSGYGAVSGGVTVAKQFSRGVAVQAGLEYYSHAGSMKLGGGGEQAFANFNFYLLNLAMKVDLSAPASLSAAAEDPHAGHMGHEGHHLHSAFPAGVMFAHMLDEPDKFMVGYRYMWNLQSGNLIHGSHPVSDLEVVNNGCVIYKCGSAPREMNMHMHMLDIMYAPTDWLNLMLMPTFMNMSMSMRELEGAPPGAGGGHHHGHGTGDRPTASGGVGDTGFYAMGKLFDIDGHHMHLTLGFSAPTGDIGQKVSGDYYNHYMMQLGSGTWDFRPSLTYTGHYEGGWSWGSQFSGIKRPSGDRNNAGYRLGDQWQWTGWTSYQLLDWMSANVRGAYTRQYAIVGGYTDSFFTAGPQDFPQNYGGRYWDVGFGLNLLVKDGPFKGNGLSVEWLQPVEANVNGYQLKPNGMLSATWSLEF